MALCLLGAAVLLGAVAGARPHRHRPPHKSRPPASSAAAHPERYRTEYVVYGVLAAPALDESSGIIASRIHPGVYWTHNDSGNPPELFAVDEFGRDLGVWRVSGATNVDWEDIASDSAGHIIIGDIGDNHHRRSDQRLYVVDEPRDLHRPGPVPVRQVHPFVFPGSHRDCEALFEWQGQYYVIEKIGQPIQASKHPAWLYRVPQNGSPSAPPPLEPLEEFDFHGPVTAADISPDGRLLAVSTYTTVFVFRRTDLKGPFLTPNPWAAGIACGQMEAVTFHPDGSGDLLMTCEQRMMYRMAATWYRGGIPFFPGARRSPASQPKP